jgi:hypothetical protein
MRPRGRKSVWRALLAASIAALSLLGPAANAGAESTYTAVQCYPGVGSEDHSSAEFSGKWRFARGPECSGPGLGLRSSRRAGGLPAQWTIAAPKGTTFSHVSVDSRRRAARGLRPALEVVGAGGDRSPISAFPADGGWHQLSARGSFSAIVSRLACGGGRQSRGPRIRSCFDSGKPFIYARRFALTVADSSPPAVSGAGGSLFSAGTKVGIQSVAVSASDRGGGLSRLFLRVNGVPTAIRSFGCATASLAVTVVANSLTPCPGQRVESLNTNTSVAPFAPGPDSVQLCASDYSDGVVPANTTCTAPQTVITYKSPCDKYAATNGNDAAAGTLAAPYRTAQRLADSLSFGQAGCLRAGTYSGGIRIASSGVSVISYPGERATISGKTYLTKTASRVRIADLNLVSGPGTGEFVNGTDDVFDGVDVTSNNTENCFIVGSKDPAYGRAVRLLIENSRIHNCGQRSPDTNMDHGIYIAFADSTIIRDNYIYDNADRGVQLYPDSRGTQVYRNVIDGNGQGLIVSGDGSTASSNNLVEDNVISNSPNGWNVESDWPGGRVGTGNIVRNNCLWSPGSRSSSGGMESPYGYVASGNVIADPAFMNRAFKDFRLQSGSACAFVYA